MATGSARFEPCLRNIDRYPIDCLSFKNESMKGQYQTRQVDSMLLPSRVASRAVEQDRGSSTRALAPLVPWKPT